MQVIRTAPRRRGRRRARTGRGRSRGSRGPHASFALRELLQRNRALIGFAHGAPGRVDAPRSAANLRHRPKRGGDGARDSGGNPAAARTRAMGRRAERFLPFEAAEIGIDGVDVLGIREITQRPEAAVPDVSVEQHGIARERAVAELQLPRQPEAAFFDACRGNFRIATHPGGPLRVRRRGAPLPAAAPELGMEAAEDGQPNDAETLRRGEYANGFLRVSVSRRQRECLFLHFANASAMAFSASGAIARYPAAFGSRPSAVRSSRKFRPCASAEYQSRYTMPSRLA